MSEPVSQTTPAEPAEPATNPSTITPPVDPSPRPEVGAPRSFAFLAPPDRPGDLGRLGPYRVAELIGTGGMGFVFQAEDDALCRLVALKVMRPEAAAEGKARDRFLREGRAAAAVRSDHVVTIYHVGEANGVPFLAMEYLEGWTLERWLTARRRAGAVPPLAILKVAKDVLKGLVAAHAKGLVHRDIKPTNLWVEKSTGRVKVLDFGLTRGRTDDQNLTRSGLVVGTPAYMAPEQARDAAKVDHRADLFSLGVVLYRMAAGKNPFERDNVFATLYALGNDHPPPAGSLPNRLPPAMAALIDRLLAKDPAARPSSTSKVLAEVTEIVKQATGDKPRATAGGPSDPQVALVMTGPAEPADPPKPAAPRRPDPGDPPAAVAVGGRKALEWVLAFQGTLTLTANGKEVRLSPNDRLPDGPFEVEEVSFSRDRPLYNGVVGHLREVPAIRGGLWLTHTDLTDDGLAKLAGFPGVRSVQRLALPMGITDAALLHLVRFDKLRSLYLTRTGVTAAGVRALAASLPGCKIVWDGGSVGPNGASSS